MIVRHRGPALVLVVACTLGLSGCGGGAAVPAVAADRELRADGAWSRPTPEGAARGVVYLTVHTDRDDAVVSAEVPAEVATSATLHRTMEHDGGAAHHGGGGGELAMESVAALPVTPSRPLVFEPGGNHVMLEGLVAPLRRGSEFRLGLVLRSGRRVEVPVVVSDEPPARIR